MGVYVIKRRTERYEEETYRVCTKLVEDVDRQIAHRLLLVEEPEAQWLQAVQMRRETGQEL